MTSDASGHSSSQVIGIDLGGTAIKLARFSRSGDLLAEAQLPTPQPAVPGAVTMALCEAVEELDPQRLAAVVGIGLPGPMDAAARVARVCINLPGWEEVPLADWLEPRLERRVTLANDGNCAVVGEAWRGAAQGYGDVVLLTLGTGVGGGVLLNGSLFTGHNGAAAEPGLIGVDPEGPACNSGNRGSLEQFASIGALRRLSEREPRELGRAAAAGDPEALAVWDRYGSSLGVGITSLVYMFTPQLVLLGGGLAGAAPHFLPALRREVESRVQAVSREGLRIEACALGNGAGRLGAARLALQRLGGMMSDS
ncbi:xylose repressor [Synechococcus sp. KORDI-49]|jgi:glucokinase|uniref:ROK family protein n=1 Tax=Synechococcales TaxID=1890424 RepID=UPI0004E05299|nr:ROK family protein [Synechococcus sp. KORDI-49]AII44958.1 xylose repressor [Synechococcus sp. KORDI-49]RCL53789.1 MAG: ROK family protein [Synechococcus sp. MED-G70]HCX54587.1 ROK family protein [Synechococcus sp. UBA9887]